MKKSFYLVILFFLLTQSSIAQYDGDQIFDDSYLHEIRITTSLSEDELFDLFFDGFDSGNYTYAISQVMIDGIALDSVGLRIKGGSTAFDNKKPYKLDFNAFVSNRKYDGLKKINLHQGDMDPSYMRETLAYGLMRNAGVKTVRTSYAKVYINEIYEGIYTLVEQINDDFIHQHFASADGALYKTTGEGLQLKYAVDSSYTFVELEAAINQIPIDQLDEQLSEYIDVDAFIRFIISQVFLDAVDGPLTANYNYYIYFEPKSETYVYIPWDYNLSLYGGANYSIFQPSVNFIFEKLKQNAVLREQYLSTFCQLLEYNFDENRVLNLIDSYRNLLADEVPNDPYISEIGDFETNVTLLENIISTKIQNLTEEMNNNFSPCNSLENPLGFQEVVINEIVASNDSTSGITDLAGGSADWIELYNNTSSNIPLNQCYLSNDADFLKHWRFRNDVVIPANDYLIIWADRDIEETGLHADFKLNKNRGALYLSFENGEIIDSVSYQNQSTNIGYARVPNGTGPYIEQATTFNATNDLMVGRQDVFLEKGFTIFPNPAKENATLKVFSLDNRSSIIQVVNMQGQVIWKKELALLVGSNLFELPLEQFNSGFIYVMLIDEKTSERQLVFISGNEN